MENQYMADLDKERVAKDRAIDLVTNITKQLLQKNKEIKKLTFYVEALTIGLTASSKAIQVLRDKEKA
jgi:hypothetical protein